MADEYQEFEVRACGAFHQVVHAGTGIVMASWPGRLGRLIARDYARDLPRLISAKKGGVGA